MKGAAVCTGSGPRRDYRNIERIIQAGRRTLAEAIHSGCGFFGRKPLFFQAVHRYYRRIATEPDFINQDFETSNIETHPLLPDYQEEVHPPGKPASLAAETNACGYNPYA